MRRLWLLVLIGAFWCVAVHGGAPAHADPLPPCVDGHYLPGQAGTACQIRGDTTPTARCWDGTFDYSLGVDACAGHGGVFRYVAASQGAAAPAARVLVPLGPMPYPSQCPNGFVDYGGNGQGPTLCVDGCTSLSAGQGTCSDHGGEVHPQPAGSSAPGQ